MSAALGFTVEIHHSPVIFAEAAARLPAHDLILRPILREANLAVLLDAPVESEVVRKAASIVSRERDRFRIALDREVIRGSEELWNTGYGARGTIAIKSRISEEKLAGLFAFCGSAWRWKVASERKVFGDRALRFASAEVAPDQRVFLLSRSNGIQWLGVYAVPNESERLFSVAEEVSKPFKRWFEVSEPERYNIIGQYDKTQKT
jgi:hypothetical protein